MPVLYIIAVLLHIFGTEIDSHVKEDFHLMAYDQNLNEDMEVDDGIQDQSDPKPIQNHGFYAEHVAGKRYLDFLQLELFFLGTGS